MNEQYKNGNQAIIEGIRKRIDKIISDYLIKNAIKPSVQHIKDALSANLTQNDNIVEQFDAFIDFKKHSNIKPSSINDYNNLKTALIDYQTTKGRTITKDNISIQFLNDFQSFLATNRNLNSNTIRKRIKSFKQFLLFVDRELFNYNSDIIRYKSVSEYDTDIITLSKSELSLIFSLQLSGMQERIRDLFIFLCNTGMRYSDLQTLKREDIKDDFIDKIAVKTNIRFKVPLNDIALNILSKYDYILPMYENQVFNRVLKDILKELDVFKEKIVVNTQTYQKSSSTTIEKWKCISSHTGRRTFITNCILSGISIAAIMDMTSHRKINTLLKYIEKFKSVNEIDREKLNMV